MRFYHVSIYLCRAYKPGAQPINQPIRVSLNSFTLNPFINQINNYGLQADPLTNN